MASNRLAPGLWSRACTSGEVLPPPTETDPFIAGLARIISRDHPAALVPGTDEALYAVSRYRDRLGSAVALGLPDHAEVQRALDKTCLAQAARAVGLAVPESEICTHPDEAVRAARGFGFPVLTKPMTAVTEVEGGLTRRPACLAVDEADLRDQVRLLGKCIVQRRIAGQVLSMAGVTTDRGLICSVFARHHRTWPPAAGMASFVETIEPSPGLTERVDALVQALGWRGLWQLQFIERSDGQLHAIDFNPRPYGCMGVAAAAGVALVANWCAWLLGDSPRPAAARAGVRWRMEDTDARHVLWQLRHRHGGVAARALSGTATTHAYFRARDPLPLLIRTLDLARVNLRRRFG